MLLFVLWYCHKRGRETRLERERSEDGSGHVEELLDDPTLPAQGDHLALPPVASGRRSPAASK